MTRRDVWLDPPRLPVLKYRIFRSEIQKFQIENRFQLPDEFKAVFYLPMPESWSKKKKTSMEGVRHQVKPDKDNLEKALLDCLKPTDSTVWHTETWKYWSKDPRIEIVI